MPKLKRLTAITGLLLASAMVLAFAAPKHSLTQSALCLWSFVDGILLPDPSVPIVGINGGESSELFIWEDSGGYIDLYIDDQNSILEMGAPDGDIITLLDPYALPNPFFTPYILKAKNPGTSGAVLNVFNGSNLVLSANTDGSIQTGVVSGSAGKWKLGAASGGTITVEIDGQKYAITATPIP